MLQANKSKNQEASAAKEAAERAAKKAAELEKKVKDLETKTKEVGHSLDLLAMMVPMLIMSLDRGACQGEGDGERVHARRAG